MKATAARGMATATTAVSAAAPARARKRVPRCHQCQHRRESD
jgi:hypothetical protein